VTKVTVYAPKGEESGSDVGFWGADGESGPTPQELGLRDPAKRGSLRKGLHDLRRLLSRRKRSE
jgi:hypothetical protein